MIFDYTILALGSKIEEGEIAVCPKCQRRGLRVEVDGHCFYTHFRILRKDDPRSVFIRRVECHVLAGEIETRTSAHALPRIASPSE
jgi:hypothetical protein